MLKKIGIPLVALAAMVTLVPAPKASAAVRFGITIGQPAYSHPVDPYAYSSPYTNDYYGYPAYQAPVYGYSYKNWRAHEYQERRRRESRERDWRGHEQRDRRDHDRGRR